MLSSTFAMDRGYVDCKRLHRFELSSAYFVVRTKASILLQRRCSRTVDKSTGLRSDHTFVLKTVGSAKAYPYPEPLRRVPFCGPETGKRLRFLANNFTIDAVVVANICKRRWAVERSSRRIKMHLRIKAFYGVSQNAVKAQIWIAISV
jgi:IS4 transposase